MSPERRQDNRHLVCAFAYVAPPAGDARRAIIADISVTGAKLLTRAKLTPGDVVELTLHLPAGVTEMRAVVLRHESRAKELADVWPYELAVRFETPLAIDEQALRELAAKQRI